MNFLFVVFFGIFNKNNKNYKKKKTKTKTKNSKYVRFGVTRFLILRPESIENIEESEVMFMMSTLSIAVFNIGCSLSHFVPCGDGWDDCFKGCLRYNQIECNMITQKQKKIPPEMQYLNGIFKIFHKHLRLFYDETDPLLQLSNIAHNFKHYKPHVLVTYSYIYDPSSNILALLARNWRDFKRDTGFCHSVFVPKLTAFVCKE